MVRLHIKFEIFFCNSNECLASPQKTKNQKSISHSSHIVISKVTVTLISLTYFLRVFQHKVSSLPHSILDTVSVRYTSLIRALVTLLFQCATNVKRMGFGWPVTT
jgi:hypothetical protein